MAWRRWAGMMMVAAVTAGCSAGAATSLPSSVPDLPAPSQSLPASPTTTALVRVPVSSVPSSPVATVPLPGVVTTTALPAVAVPTIPRVTVPAVALTIPPTTTPAVTVSPAVRQAQLVGCTQTAASKRDRTIAQAQQQLANTLAQLTASGTLNSGAADAARSQAAAVIAQAQTTYTSDVAYCQAMYGG